MKLSQDAKFFAQKASESKYWDMMSTEHGLDTVVRELQLLLPI
jgi:hypothetical protein